MEFKTSSDRHTRTLFVGGKFVAWCQPWLTPKVEEFLAQSRDGLTSLTFTGRKLGTAPFQIDSLTARFVDGSDVQRMAAALADQSAHVEVSDTEVRIGSFALPIES